MFFLESVVILNIPYWGAGVKPWELGSGHKEFNFTPSFSDKKLEVFCVFSSFHIAQMQVGLSEPHRVGQAREVRIKLTGSVPMQIDGEPWEQHPAEISLQHHAQVGQEHPAYVHCGVAGTHAGYDTQGLIILVFIIVVFLSISSPVQ